MHRLAFEFKRWWESVTSTQSVIWFLSNFRKILRKHSTDSSDNQQPLFVASLKGMKPGPRENERGSCASLNQTSFPSHQHTTVNLKCHLMSLIDHTGFYRENWFILMPWTVTNFMRTRVQSWGSNSKLTIRACWSIKAWSSLATFHCPL